LPGPWHGLYGYDLQYFSGSKKNGINVFLKRFRDDIILDRAIEKYYKMRNTFCTLRLSKPINISNVRR
jgi:hypothetical protein